MVSAAEGPSGDSAVHGGVCSRHTAVGAADPSACRSFHPLRPSVVGWSLMSAWLALSTLVLMQITQLGWRRILILILLAIDPLAKSFLYGQMHLLVFFLLTLAVWLSQRNWPTTAGVSVAVAAALKLYPALFSCCSFCAKSNGRPSPGQPVDLPFWQPSRSTFLDGNVHRIYLVEILPRMGLGENIDPYASGWNSLTALLHRLFIAEPELNPHPLVNVPSLYALVHSLCQAAIFIPALWLLSPGTVKHAQENLEWAAFAAMLIAFSPVTGSYHLCLLILAAASRGRCAPRREPPSGSLDPGGALWNDLSSLDDLGNRAPQTVGTSSWLRRESTHCWRCSSFCTG